MFRKASVMLLAGLFLTGCHICKNPEESNECFPLCIKKREDNRILTENGWNSFNNFRTRPYHRVGIRLIDNGSMIIAKLSDQIVEEVVKPYVELDKERLIVVYYQFEKDVFAVADKQQCSMERAVQLTWQDWEKQPNGMENCAKLRRAIPFIRNMRTGNQILKAAIRINYDVQRLLIDLPQQVEELKRQIKTSEGITLATLAGIQLTARLYQLSAACAYLGAMKADASEQRRQIEDFVTKFNAD